MSAILHPRDSCNFRNVDESSLMLRVLLFMRATLSAFCRSLSCDAIYTKQKEKLTEEFDR